MYIYIYLYNTIRTQAVVARARARARASPSPSQPEWSLFWISSFLTTFWPSKLSKWGLNQNKRTSKSYQKCHIFYHFLTNEIKQVRAESKQKDVKKQLKTSHVLSFFDHWNQASVTWLKTKGRQKAINNMTFPITFWLFKFLKCDLNQNKRTLKSRQKRHNFYHFLTTAIKQVRPESKQKDVKKLSTTWHFRSRFDCSN